MDAVVDSAPSRSASPASPLPRTGDFPQAHGDRRLTPLRTEHARLSAQAAQARGRGEWALAAQVAGQIAALDAGLLSARTR